MTEGEGAGRGGSPDRVAVGRVSRAHGIRGEVAVHLHTENPHRFEPEAVVTLEDGRALTVETSRPHQHRLLVKFAEVADRAAADALRGAYLFVGTETLPELPEGTYWPHQIEGCEVADEEGTVLGTLAEVLHTPANDVWIVRGAGEERLVPALRDVVASVDLGARRIVVRAGRLQ